MSNSESNDTDRQKSQWLRLLRFLLIVVGGPVGYLAVSFFIVICMILAPASWLESAESMPFWFRLLGYFGSVFIIVFGLYLLGVLLFCLPALIMNGLSNAWQRSSRPLIKTAKNERHDNERGT